MKIIVSNWKMNGTLSKINQYFDIFLSKYKNNQNRIIFSLPYVFLHHAVEMTKGYNVEIFAQNCHFENEGAFTGEISAKMLSSIGIKGSIIGHFERRQFGETYQLVNKKIKSLIDNNLTPIVCIGETKDEKNIKTVVLENQIDECLHEVDNKNIIIAYEPIWAIGQNKSMSIENIIDSINIIREKCKELNLSNIKILYGGAVNENNVNKILLCEHIDGILIGRASLNPNFMIEII